MNILNMSAFNDVSYFKAPWEWGVIDNLISINNVKLIADEVKKLNFQSVSSKRSDKNYSMGLIDLQKYRLKSGTLNQLVFELTSNEYLSNLESVTNSQLRSREIELNIWCYGMADYLSPHVDKDYKFLTQLIYLNECWESNYGGTLNILGSNNEDDLYERIQPKYIRSPLIKNSQNAWHSVSPVSPNAPSRYCLQMIFKD